MAKRYTGQGGSPNRKLRYPVKLTIKISKDADALLKEMAAEKDTKPATIGRRAVMKDLYIYKAERDRHQQVQAELGDSNGK